MAVINRGLSRRCPAVPPDSLQARGNKRWYGSDSIRREEQNRTVALAKFRSVPASEQLWKIYDQQRSPVAQSDHRRLP